VSLKLQLVGYYQACERLDDTALVPVGEKVAGTIKSGFNDTVAFVVRSIVGRMIFSDPGCRLTGKSWDQAMLH
jgi:Uncharacterised protein family (UPF0172)